MLKATLILHLSPHQLSGGEQQRVVIARTLLNDPEIILTDEPTGNLDSASTEEIMKILMDIAGNGRAVLMATHDYHQIKKRPFTTLKCENEKLVPANLSEADIDRLIQNDPA
jgi:cell division transport system ATP-binding protein